MWSGFLLAALIPLYLRDFLGVTENLRRKSVIGITLIAVTGLDIVPTVYEFFRAHRITADMEWWDPVQITSWTDALIWVPHHVMALVACLIGFLALWNVRMVGENPYPKQTRRLPSGIFAAFAFAAAAGLSVYVTFAFAIFLLIWGFRLLAKRVYQDFFLYLGTACCTILFSIPYLHDLLAHPATGTAVGAMATGAVAAGAAAAGAGATATGISGGPFALGLRVLPNFLSTPVFLTRKRILPSSIAGSVRGGHCLHPGIWSVRCDRLGSILAGPERQIAIRRGRDCFMVHAGRGYVRHYVRAVRGYYQQ